MTNPTAARRARPHRRSAGPDLLAAWRRSTKILKVGWPAVLVVISMDAIPVVSFAELFPSGSLRLADVAFLALVAVAISRRQARSEAEVARWRTSAFAVGLLLAGCWLFALVHAILNEGRFLNSLLFGRDYLFLAALVPIAPWLFPTREHWDDFVAVLLFFASLLAVASIAASLGVAPPSIVHASKVVADGGLVRVWTSSGALLTTGFSLALGNALIRKRSSAAELISAGLLTTVVVLTMSRALYFGLIAAMLLTPIVWVASSRDSSDTKGLYRRLGGATAAIIAVLLVTSAAGISAGPLEQLGSRASSGLTAVSGGANTQRNTQDTWAHRLEVGGFMLGVLGDSWPVGLGFIHPADHFFVGLKKGSIRDTDVGSLGPLMTMGIIGAVAVFLPLLGLLGLMARHGPPSAMKRRGYMFGLLFYTIFALASSPTLGVVSDTTSAIVLAVMLGLGLRGAEFSIADCRSPAGSRGHAVGPGPAGTPHAGASLRSDRVP